MAASQHPLRRSAVLLAALLAGGVLAAPAAAAAPSNSTEAQAHYEAVEAEVAGLKAQVSAVDETIQRTTVEAEAAGDAARAAEAALATPRSAAAKAAAELRDVQARVDRMQHDVAALGREAYIGEGRFGSAATLLDSAGPGELLERAATMELLGADRAEQLQALEDAEARVARADQAARAAVANRDHAARAAQQAQAAADAKLVQARRDVGQLSAQKSQLEERLKAAEIELFRLRGVERPEAMWQLLQEAREAAGQVTLPVASVTVLPAAGDPAASATVPSAGGVAFLSGRVSSCYGARWGTMHYGVDIAAPIGTPIYAPEGGTVVAAGPARGFGLAVALQHGDGTITLYGHVNQMYVSVGQAVSAGQQIAEVGNRGQSTGPHLHFEVHTGGLYAHRQNPVPWLTAHGISLGGSC